MPQAYVKELAKKHNMSIKLAESRWKAAKKAAAGEGHDDDYAYVTGIFKNMMKESAPTPKSQFTKAELDDDAKMVDAEADKKIRKAKTTAKTAGDKIAITKMKLKKTANASKRTAIKGLDESVMIKAKGIVADAVRTIREGAGMDARRVLSNHLQHIDKGIGKLAKKNHPGENVGTKDNYKASKNTVKHIKLSTVKNIAADLKSVEKAKKLKESASDIVLKAVSIVHEAKVQQTLRECKASSFKEFLINEADIKSKITESEDETLEDILKKGKANYNSWYTGFYRGYHGTPYQESKADKHYKAGYKEGESVKSDDEPFSK